jgi:hypothetical protein
VCVYKTRKHDSTTGVDDLAVVIDQTLDGRARSDVFYLLIANEKGAILDDGKSTQFIADSRTCQPGDSHDL